MNRFYIDQTRYVKDHRFVVISRRLAKLIESKSAKNQWIKTYLCLDRDKIRSPHFNFLLIGPDGLILAVRRADDLLHPLQINHRPRTRGNV